MAFKAKVDYCGLTANDALKDALLIKDDNPNESRQKYQPQGQDGSYVLTEVYGEDSSPSNNYGLKKDLSLAAGAVKLNAVTKVGGKCYALEKISIGTGASKAVTISASCKQIEADATDSAQCHYPVPALTLTRKQHAQILFGAFTVTGGELTECSAAIGGSVSTDKVAGVTISSDINSGVITVSGKILQTGDEKPTVNVADGWVLTVAPSGANPETAYPEYSFEVEKILAKNEA